MSTTGPEILGSAVFGTSQGLSIQGNGILDISRDTSGLFEFKIGDNVSARASLKVLGEDGDAIFRRRVSDASGNPIELLGYLKVCKDASRRYGFAGACVAVHADRIYSQRPLPDWLPAFDYAESIFRRLNEHISRETNILKFPSHRILEKYQHPPQAQPRKANNRTELLHVDAHSIQSSPPCINRLQAISHEFGERIPTIILTNSPGIRGATDLFDPNFESMIANYESLQAEAVTELEPPEEQTKPAPRKRALKVVRTADQASHPEPEQADPSSPHNSGLPPDVKELFLRLEQLERDFISLTQYVEDNLAQKTRPAARPQVARAPSGSEKIGRQELPDQGLTLTAKLGLGAGVVMLIAVLAVVAIFMLRNGDAEVIPSSTTDSEPELIEPTAATTSEPSRVTASDPMVTESFEEPPVELPPSTEEGPEPE